MRKPARIRDLTVREIRQRFVGGDLPRGATWKELMSDPRAGVRQVSVQLESLREKIRAERRRLGRLQRLERELRRRGFEHVAGVDEVGVGPLAGPVVAAAVVMAPGRKIEGVDDSKKLDAATRLRLAAEIHQHADSVGIGEANVEEIERLNVYQAALLAMRRAVLKLRQVDYVLTDARVIPGLETPQQPVDKGDSRCFSIAAASIVAKIHRDDLMTRLDRLYPDYGLSRHKGYSTKAHKEAIRRLGCSPCHRRSFQVIAELTGECCGAFYRLEESISNGGRFELEDVAARLGIVEGDLSPAEVQRLRLLLARRRKRLEALVT